MLYVVHFSFLRDLPNDDTEVFHGYFTAVVEAQDVDAALEKLEALILSLSVKDDVFEGVDAVFLDACVECREIPTTGFMAYFKQWMGPGTATIETAIRGAGEDQVAVYDIGPDEPADEGAVVAVEPFVRFSPR